ncbi:MAG: hypothetical protein KME23_23955 [Goleter apudmare HA4340-LM2]|jgi:hypothetical protein|nr:hypothetical protein [Goleter apudmare HA4340-LM2]
MHLPCLAEKLTIFIDSLGVGKQTMQSNLSISPIFRLFKSLRTTILRVVLPSSLFLILIQVVCKIKGIPFAQLVIDANAAAQLPAYTGMISMLGIFFWCTSAAISIFISYVMKKIRGLESRKWSRFLLFSGCITLMLVFDDLFQIHEYYYYPFIDLNAVENPVFVRNFWESVFFSIYIVLILIYLFKFKSLFKKTNYSILFLSLLFFAISIIVDVGTPDEMFLHNTIEEGSKFLGIVVWFSYFLDCSYQQIQKLIFNINSDL